MTYLQIEKVEKIILILKNSFKRIKDIKSCNNLSINIFSKLSLKLKKLGT